LTLTIKAVLLGKTGQLFTVPEDPTTGYAVTLTISNDPFTGAYCSGNGTATPTRNDAQTFEVKNDTAPGGCLLFCSPRDQDGLFRRVT
jgi:hypothetical protein